MLGSWFTVAVDCDGFSRRRRHLHVMLLAFEGVSHIPQLRARLAGHAGAALNILGLCLLRGTVATYRPFSG